MARLEAEREAGREDPAAREERVKRAFRELCMVYRLGEEDFAPPSPSGKKNGGGAGEEGDGGPGRRPGVSPGGLDKIEEDAEADARAPSPDGIATGPAPAASGGGGGPADAADDTLQSIDLGGRCADPDDSAGAPGLPPVQERRESGGSSVYESPLDDYWTLPADSPESPAEAPGGRQPPPFAVAGLGAGEEEVEAIEASALAARLVRPPAPRPDGDGRGEAPGYLHLRAGRRGRAHTSDGITPPAAVPADVEISDQCAICLCEYGADDVVVTSQNPDCSHVSLVGVV